MTSGTFVIIMTAVQVFCRYLHFYGQSSIKKSTFTNKPNVLICNLFPKSFGNFDVLICPYHFCSLSSKTTDWLHWKAGQESKVLSAWPLGASSTARSHCFNTDCSWFTTRKIPTHMSLKIDLHKRNLKNYIQQIGF